mmetsp:Transcript_16061/g.34799  ORF Transcript_16061/g.34799 Transcript_16061/m.34799 type:complete len:324 (+) Transcript_16061:175-1146(+)
MHQTQDRCLQWIPSLPGQARDLYRDGQRQRTHLHLPTGIRPPRNLRMCRRQPSHPQTAKRSQGGPNIALETGGRIPRAHGGHRGRQRRRLPPQSQNKLQSALAPGLSHGSGRIPRQLHRRHAVGESALRKDPANRRHRRHRRVQNFGKRQGPQKIPIRLSPAHTPLRLRGGGRVPKHHRKLFVPVSPSNQWRRLSQIRRLRLRLRSQRHRFPGTVVLRGRDLVRRYVQTRANGAGSQSKTISGRQMRRPERCHESVLRQRQRRKRGRQGTTRRQSATTVRSGHWGDDSNHGRGRALCHARKSPCQTLRLHLGDRSHLQGRERL